MLRLSICLIGWVVTASAVELPAGSVFCVRLEEPLSSDRSRAGDSVHGLLAVPIEMDGKVILPARTPVSGRVRAVRKVGLGFRRDRAVLDVEFFGIHPADGDPIPMEARVLSVDNARERTAKDGRIHGATAAEVPQVFFTLRSYQLPLLTPVPDPFRLLRLAAFPFFPQPEIRLPRGTDFWVRLKEPITVPDSGGVREDGEMKIDVSRLPSQVQSKKGKPADVVNLVFVGTEQELDEAFEKAGWDEAHKKGWKSVFRSARNVFEQRYDPHQPMSGMLLNGRPADRQYQRGLNIYTKRHHLRIWRLDEEIDGKPVWVGAATHDIGIRFLWKRFHFTHAIAPKIDIERTKVATDLAFSGCVADAGFLPREFPATLHNAEGARMETDGGVVAMRLKPCEHTRVGSAEELKHLYKWDMPLWKRVVQRQVLIVRNDFLRLNVLWNAGSLTKRAVTALVRRGDHRNPAEAMIMPNTRWSPGTEKVLSSSIARVPVSALSVEGSIPGLLISGLK